MTVTDDFRAQQLAASATQATGPNAGQVPETARRLALLADNGHQWMHPQVQTALATSTMSDQSLLAAAQGFKGAMNDAFQPITSAFEDPVLHKTPSFALQAHQWLTNNLGWAPVAQPDLTVIQRKLQAKGFGSGLPTDGAWTGAWHDAWEQAWEDHVQQQIAGEGKLGNTTAHKAVGGFLSSLMPRYWIPTLIGFAKSIPGDLRDVASDTIAGVQTVTDPRTYTGGGEGYAERVAHLEAGLFNRSAQRSPEEYARLNVEAHPWSRLIQDVSTAMLLLPAGRAGLAITRAAGDAIGKGVFTDLGAEAAQRGPGAIAKSLYYSKVNPETQELMRSGLFTTKPFQNLPVLRQIAQVGKVLDDDGLYYKVRSTLAYPMRYPAVQLGVNAANRGMLLGVEARGAAATEGVADKGHTQSLTHNVYSMHAIAGPLGATLDVLGALGRPDKLVLGVSATQAVTQTARHVDTVLHGSLADHGVVGAFERGTGLDYDELVKAHGSEAVDGHLNDKLNEFAADHYADDVIRQMGRDQPTDLAQLTDLRRSLRHDALHDPAKLRASRDEMLSSLTEPTIRFAADSNAIRMDTRVNPREEFGRYLAAKAAMQDLSGRFAHILLSPATTDTLAAAKALGSDAEREQAATAPAALLDQAQTAIPKGRLGIARADTVTAEDAARTAAHLFARLRAAGAGDAVDQALMDDRLAQLPVTVDGTTVQAASQALPKSLIPTQETAAQAVNDVRMEGYRYLTNEFGLDPADLDRFDPIQMVKAVAVQARQAARSVHLPVDAPQEAVEAARKLADAGYKPVWGTDIGFAFGDPIIDPVLVEGHGKAVRSLAAAAGLGHYSTADIAKLGRQELLRIWQAEIDSGKVRVPPGMNAARLYRHALTQLGEVNALPALGRALLVLAPKFSPELRRTLDYLVRSGAAKDHAEAENLLQRSILDSQPLTSVNTKTFVKAMTKPAPDVANEAAGLPPGTPMMSEVDAQRLFGGVLRAYAARPYYAMGLSKVEDVFRSSLGLAGKTVPGLPLVSSLIRRSTFLPNNLLALRNRWRFAYSPMFSARRLVKTTVKMGAAGVTPTSTPLATMMKRGVFEDASKLLDKVYPEEAARSAGWTDMDAFLHSQDFFGIYNLRHFMALAAHELHHDQGVPIPELRAKLDRIFTYGDRTAFERSAGTLFYPLSFNKTLYRNLGGFMLDRPGARLAVVAGMDAYAALDQHHAIDEWVKKYLPVASEVNKLNAFHEGVGLGQFGGINAPLLGMLMPQHATSPWPVSLLKAAVPAWNDLNALLVSAPGSHGVGGGELWQQGQVTYWAARNAVDDATRLLEGHPRGALNPQHPVETATSQITDGWQLRNTLITKLGSVIDFNYHHRGSEIRFATDPRIPVAIQGLPVNRTNLGVLVHEFYPAFDPMAAQQLAVKHQAEAQRQLQTLRGTDPQRFTAYSTFAKLADKVAGYASHDEYSDQQLAALTTRFRAVAVALAESDPFFRKWYDASYDNVFGPLEGVTA